ncbi:MAG: Cna B-type domain-containing protein [Clostridia bacterium]|nr:Cna B-type domain-containing protein [Clostridia bacterium]
MNKKFLAFISLVMCLCLCTAPMAAFAISTTVATEPISVSASCSLTLNYTHNGKAFPDVSVKLYQVASVSADYQYTLTPAFSATGLQLNGVSAVSEWNGIRTTLENAVAANAPAATVVQATGTNGQVTFTGLQPGMYLVMPVTCSENGFLYYFASVLTAVPNLNENGVWNYDVQVNPKPDVENPTGEDLCYRVLKLWSDNQSPNRPVSIEVNILRDSEVVRTVVLSAENDWNYAWYAAADGSIWSVSEPNVPSGYVMRVEKQETTFTITNAIPTPPSDSPQTGDTTNIGFFVMLMCISGLVLVIVGFAGKRKSE